MRKFALILMLTYAVVQSATHAQTPATSPFNGAEAGAFYQLHLPNINSFNESLGRNNLPELGNTLHSLGVGGGIFLKRIFFGGQGAWQFGMAGANSNYDTRYSGGNGMVKVGYTFVKNSSFALYPALGLGGGGHSIRVTEGPGYQGQSAETPLQPGENLHSAYMLADLGINLDFFTGAEDAAVKLLLGVSAGYQFSPYQSGWDYGSREIESVEKFAPQGFYVMFKVGWNNSMAE